MASTKDIVAGKKYPTWISNHKVFKSNEKINKVFPEIGLPNTEIETEIDNSKEILDSASNLLNQIYEVMGKRFTNLGKFSKKKTEEEKLTAKRSKKVENCRHILQTIREELHKSPKKFIVNNKGKITLNLPADVKDMDGNVVLKSGEGLFRAYNKINEVFFVADTSVNCPRWITYLGSNSSVPKTSLQPNTKLYSLQMVQMGCGTLQL